MILSMTGYGSSDLQNDQLILSVEIRTVNSRFLDFFPRLPRVLSPFEDDALKLVKKSCIRGRVNLTAKLDYVPGAKNGLSLNQEKLEEYMGIVKDIQQKAQRDDLPTMGDILRLPDIMGAGDNGQEEELKTIFLKATELALKETNKIRVKDGLNIQSDL